MLKISISSVDTVTSKNGQMFDSFQYFLNFQYDIISNKSENLHI